MHRIFPIDVDNIEEFYSEFQEDDEEDNDGDGGEKNSLDKLDDCNGNDAQEEGHGLLAVKLKTENQVDDVSNGQIEEEKLIKCQPRRGREPPCKELKNSSHDSKDALAAVEIENNVIMPVIEEEVKEPEGESETVQITVKITREKKVAPLINS